MENIITGLIIGAIFGAVILTNRENDNFKVCKKGGGKIYKKPLGMFFHEEVCVLNNEISKGGVKLGKGEIMPREILSAKNKATDKQPISKKKIYFGFFLSLLGLVAWNIPILGIIISVYGLIIAIKGIDTSRKIALLSIVLCVIGIILSIINGYAGARQGATGNNARVNQILK